MWSTSTVAFRCFCLLALCKHIFCVTSPCPDVFQYQNDGSRVYGLISVPIPVNFNNLINLEVQFIIGNQVGDYIGTLEVADQENVVPQKIQRNEPILFKLNFPAWYKILPHIQKISVNENVICWGNPQRVPYTLTITLKYNLSINGFNSNSNYNYNRRTSSEWNTRDYSTQTQPSIQQQPLYEEPVVYTSNRHPELEWNNQPFWKYSVANYSPTTTSPPPLPPPPRPILRLPFNPPTETPGKKSASPTSFNTLTTQPFAQICGVVSSTVSLIANAESANKSHYPWLGGLFKSSDKEPQFTCGASLITNKHALTAGHCVEGVAAKRFYLVLGREYIYNWLGDGEHIQVKSIITHQDVKPENGDGDIAILTLVRNVTFSRTIRPICLWNGNDDLSFIVGKTGVVVGWGEDEYKSYVKSPKKANLPIVTQKECLESNVAFNLIVSERTFCAGYRNDTGPCKGDSGNGFYMKHNNRWTIRGIVSQAVGTANLDCDLKQYIVFADVAKFRDWILRYINN